MIPKLLQSEAMPVKTNPLSTYHDGLYEKVINTKLSQILTKAIEEDRVWANQEDLDPQEAPHYLSLYVQKLVKYCLKDLADRNSTEALSNEINLANALIQTLQKRHPDLGNDTSIIHKNTLLLSLQHKKNSIAEKKWPRPETSLSRSFLFTNSRKDVNIGTELVKEIESSDHIDLLVSFIKYSGLLLLLPALRTFTARGGKLRIITTTYMGATDPKAIIELSKLPNTEIHISYNVKETRLHAKSYIFYRDSGYSTAYVGSSNLSHAAIAEGLEWNMKLTAMDMPQIFEKMKATFETYWHSEDFESFSLAQAEQLWAEIETIRHPKSTRTEQSYYFDMHPYPFQQTILDALTMEREGKGHWKNLVVAATGTGKTAISAFDYRHFAESRKPRPTRLLFIAHRKEILEQSVSCFRQVLRDANFGELAVGEYHAIHPEHLFMSIQMLNSSHFLDHMSPDYYDMIIVDEFHHAAASSYQALLSHFKPKILLGLTATPERMDGKSILPYFENHIAAEIRLPDAIERRLLCPFHYFGASDPVSLETVHWRNGQYDTKELDDRYVHNSATAYKRAEAILTAIDQYTADIRDVKGIGFCVSQLHAKFMADFMNEKGISSLSLDANTTKEDRKAARDQLESDEIHFLFVVDLFNEGVDIPSINTVLFLRPTNSMTIFLQQLGRGLRLAPNKGALTVLDFVAQSSRKYDFSRRFASILTDSNKDIRKEIQQGFPHTPKGCFIYLEKQAQSYILDNIRRRLRQNEFFKEQIRELTEIKGAPPTLYEFLKALHLSPEVFYNKKRSYTRLCMEANVIPSLPEMAEEEHFQKAIPRILSIDSPKWIQYLKCQYIRPIPPTTEIEKQYIRMWQYTLYGKDYTQCGLKTPLDIFRDSPFKAEILQLLDVLYDGISMISKQIALPYPCALDVHSHYSRDQILAALGHKNPPSMREGVCYAKDLHTDVFLVTLNKSEKEFSDTTLYEDYSIDSTHFHWQSQSTTSIESATGQRYIHQKENGNIVLLFVRSQKRNTYQQAMSYTFLGTAQYESHEGSRPMTIIYKLDTPIPAKYITMTDSSGAL